VHSLQEQHSLPLVRPINRISYIDAKSKGRHTSSSSAPSGAILFSSRRLTRSSFLPVWGRSCFDKSSFNSVTLSFCLSCQWVSMTRSPGRTYRLASDMVGMAVVQWMGTNSRWVAVTVTSGGCCMVRGALCEGSK
jgi:hypothetical protein